MTKIEWVRGDDGSDGLSWNVLRAERWIERKGKMVKVSANHCEHVNEACRFCYAEAGNPRLGGLPFKPGHRKDYTFTLDEEKLLAPLKRKKPTRYFVESVSDVFGEWWPREFVDKLYAVMAQCQHHTFINLSKRPARRRDYLADPALIERLARQIVLMECGSDNAKESIVQWAIDAETREAGGEAHIGGKAGPSLRPWPLPNVIEGTSVSCQDEADKFVPILLQTKAAWRAVSAEPLLGPIDFAAMPFATGDIRHRFDALTGQALLYCDGVNGHPDMTVKMEKPIYRGLDWVITGGESGQKARPAHVDWYRSIRDQCAAAGVAYFHKQNGEWLCGTQYQDVHRDADPDLEQSRFACMDWDGEKFVPSDSGWSNDLDQHAVFRVGKKAAGRLLDGVEHSAFPELRP